MVRVDPRRSPAAQGSAVLPPVRRERRDRVHRLCVGAESLARHVRRAGAPPAGGRGFREGRIRQLSPPQRRSQLATLVTIELATIELATTEKGVIREWRLWICSPVIRLDNRIAASATYCPCFFWNSSKRL